LNKKASCAISVLTSTATEHVTKFLHFSLS
jgi:hypothetical protein